MTDRISVPTPYIELPPLGKAEEQERLRAYYDEWPRLKCSENRCHMENYGGRFFVGIKAEARTVCPFCKKGILTVVDPVTFDPDVEEDDAV